MAAKRREIGLRPLARARKRRRCCAAAFLPTQLLDDVLVVVDEPHETRGERLRYAALHQILGLELPGAQLRAEWGC